MPAAASAYPYARWPHLRRGEVQWLRRIARGQGGQARRRAETVAATLLGVDACAAPGMPELWPAAQAHAALAPPLLALCLEQLEGARALPLLCVLPPELGARLVDHVLGGDGRPGHVIGAGLDELSLGVLGYLAARVAAALERDVRVRGMLTDPERAIELLGAGRVLVWPLALELGGVGCGALRLFAGEASSAQLAASAAQPPSALPSGLRAVPLTLCAHAARVTLTRGELSDLACGDVVVPERCQLARAKDGFAGQVWLHAQGSSRGGWACSARGTELAIERFDLPEDTVMTEAKRIQTQALDPGEAALRVAGDAPIELCLELARFTLPLQELSALRPGEVLCTGRAIGERVALCAGGRAFARGELVEVEGEIGVRITEVLR